MAEPEDGSGLDLVGQAAPADSDLVGRRSLPYKTACEGVRDRASYAIEVAQRNNWLVDIALDHLSLGRAHLGLALTSESPDFTEAVEHMNQAVDGIRSGGQMQWLPSVLLARTALRRLRDSPDAAASDLRDAQEIAERGHMRLHEADVHLEWTRLSLQTGDHADARVHLGRARELVASTGYGRREREVAYLERRLAPNPEGVLPRSPGQAQRRPGYGRPRKPNPEGVV